MKDTTKNILDTKEVSNYIGVSVSKVYQLIRQRKIPFSRIGRKYKFSKDVIDNWLKENIVYPVEKEKEKGQKQKDLFKEEK